MPRKMMILCSSPRKNGNTRSIVNWVAQGAQEQHAQVEVIDVAQLSYKANGCTSCMSCQKSEKFECVIPDEASAILARIPDYEVLVLASPIYFAGFNAQLKLMLDRMFSLVKINMETYEIRHNFKPGRVLALIATAGGSLEDSGLRIADQTGKAISEVGSSRYESLLVPSTPLEVGKIQADTALKEKALAFGRKLATA